MEDIKDDLALRLLRQSMHGRNASFIELATFLLPKIYPIIFSLLPKEEIAVQTLVKVLLRAKKNIHNLEKEYNLIPWLKKLSIMESINYLREVERINLTRPDVEYLCKTYNFNLSEIEKEFLLLDCQERVALSLTEIAGLNYTQISNVMHNMSEVEVQQVIRSARNKLIVKFPFDEIRDLSEDGWKKLDENLKKLDQGSKLDLNDFEFELINKYLSYSRAILNSTLRHLMPADNIISKLREELLQYADEVKLEQKNKKEAKRKAKEIPIAPSINFDKQQIKDPINWKSKKNKKIAMTLVSVILLYSIYVIFFLPGSTWTIENSRGIIQVNSSSAFLPKLEKGDEIESLINSSTTLKFSNIAAIQIFPKTRLKLIESSDSKSVFDLITGKIEFDNINTSEPIIIDEGNKYLFNISNVVVSMNNSRFILEKRNSDFELLVINGWLNIDFKGRRNFLVKNYMFSNDLVAPHHVLASKKIVNILKRKYSNTLSSSEIRSIVEVSTEKDVITLWNLLYLSPSTDQKIILNKINEFYPIDAFGFDDEILSLDEEKMNNLKDFLYNNINRDEI